MISPNPFTLQVARAIVGQIDRAPTILELAPYAVSSTAAAALDPDEAADLMSVFYPGAASPVEVLRRIVSALLDTLITGQAPIDSTPVAAEVAESARFAIIRDIAIRCGGHVPGPVSLISDPYRWDRVRLLTNYLLATGGWPPAPPQPGAPAHGFDS